MESRLIPWDRDNAFKGRDYPIWPEGMRDNILTNQLMRVPELRAFYLESVMACVQAATAREESPDGGEPGPPWLEREIRRQYELIREAAHADRNKIDTNEVFEASIAVLMEFARERPDHVRAAVGVREAAGDQ
jgi:hypothetical protein